MVLYFVATIILARILSPHEFGIMAIISILIGVSGIFFENTLGAALVHVEKANLEFSGSVFSSAMILAVLLAISMFFMANGVAGYFGMMEIAEIARFCSLVFIVHAFQVVPYALMQRDGNFLGIGRAELIATAIGAIAAIAAATSGFGIWSLVLLLLTISVIKTVLLVYLSGWSVRARLDLDSMRSIWRYCSGLLGANAFNYLATSIDQLLVGRLFGSASLGSYRLATQLVAMPQMVMTLSANRVYFFRYKQTETESEVRVAHLLLLKWTAFLAFPILIGLAVTSQDLTHVMFGEKWSGMPYLMSMLAISSLFPVLGAMNLPVFLYKGATSVQLRMTLITRSLYIGCLVVGATYGISGMLYGILAARVLGFYIAFTYAGKLIDLTVRQVLLAIWPALAASLIMGVGVWGVRVLMLVGTSSWQILLGQFLMGTLLYGVSYKILTGASQGHHGGAGA